jgi:hypothetical protein
MKKTYQIPTTTVVNVKPQLMTETSNSIKVGVSYNGTDAIQSRRGGSVWDDDEE